jgi:hypothetical protein
MTEVGPDLSEYAKTNVAKSKKERFLDSIRAVKNKFGAAKERFLTNTKSTKEKAGTTAFKAKRAIAIGAAVLGPQGVGDDVLGVGASLAANTPQPESAKMINVKDADTTAWRRQFVKHEPQSKVIESSPPKNSQEFLATKQDTLANLRTAPDIPKATKAKVSLAPSNRPPVVPTRR